jgi:hypothetical protein
VNVSRQVIQADAPHAGLIWGMIAYAYAQNDIPHVMGNAVRHIVFTEMRLQMLEGHLVIRD